LSLFSVVYVSADIQLTFAFCTQPSNAIFMLQAMHNIVGALLF